MALVVDSNVMVIELTELDPGAVVSDAALLLDEAEKSPE